MDEKTRSAIDKVVAKTIQKVGFNQPPITIEPILQELEVDRDFVDLEDPSLLGRFKNILRVGGAFITNILGKIKLEGIWLPKEGKILVQKNITRSWVSRKIRLPSIPRIITWCRVPGASNLA